MSARCPECQHQDLRVHGSLCHASFRRWLWIGPKVPVARTVALECSCARCLYAFVLREQGVSPAPRQDAYNQLRDLKAGIDQARDGTHLVEPRAPQPPAARPAPDPRTRRK